MICEPYSGYCQDLTRVEETGTATSTPRGPAELPLTGATYGDMISVALLLVLIGALIVMTVKKVTN